MNALHDRLPQVHFELFTEVPEWFFEYSLPMGYTYHRMGCDVGLAQVNPFEVDLAETIRRLDGLFTNRSQVNNKAIDILFPSQCKLVLCDIAFTGIEVAEALGIPSILIENFTWDFIYAGYYHLAPALESRATELARIYRRATYHLQTKPVCQPNENILQFEPVSRPPRLRSNEVRSRLGVGSDQRLILVTTGGIRSEFHSTEVLKRYPEITFLIPGTSESAIRDANLIRLPHRTGYYSPDLVSACDAVVAKLGYSTVAEVYHAGLPFGFIPRPDFPETESMRNFVQSEMSALELPLQDYLAGEWDRFPQRLVELPRSDRSGINGADQIADFILDQVLQRPNSR